MSYADDPTRTPDDMGPHTASRRAFLKKTAAAGVAVPALGLAMRSGQITEARFVPRAMQAGTPAAGASTPVASDAPQGGTLVLLGHQEIASLSPDDAGPTVHFVIVTQMHNALLEIDENYVYQPVLATEEPTLSEDGLEYTFTLREGVTFHDGEPFTSEDVKYTYEWYMDPENAAVNANNFSLVESVEAPDDTTVIVRMKSRNAAFYSQVAATFIVPAHYHGEIGEDAYKASPIGTGAFRLNTWDAARSTSVVAYDGHFRGRPNLDEVRLDVVPEASVRSIALENGEADSSVWPLISEDDQRLAESGEFTTFVTPSSAVNHFPLNNRHPVLSDKRVRQAMLHAVDRQAVVDDIFGGAATVATANLSPAVEQYYNAEVPTYAYDPDRAGQLLDEAGWVMGDDGVREKDGAPCEFVCTVITGDQARRPEAEVVQSYLAEVGVDMQIEEAPVATILEQLRAGDMDAALFNWTYGDGTDPDASVTLKSDGTNNFSHFENARVDELLAAGLEELDPDARAEIYREVQAIVADEVPFLFMMYWDIFSHFNPRVGGLPPSALTADPIYAKAYQLFIEPEA
ncbi:MAG: ABC transporter substrate-binding protein [Chloroflexota bacterium]|nr:ABC transporter substrate-binding protein [Chloroflexota bacterium]